MTFMVHLDQKLTNAHPENKMQESHYMPLYTSWKVHKSAKVQK